MTSARASSNSCCAVATGAGSSKPETRTRYLHKATRIMKSIRNCACQRSIRPRKTRSCCREGPVSNSTASASALTSSKLTVDHLAQRKGAFGSNCQIFREWFSCELGQQSQGGNKGPLHFQGYLRHSSSSIKPPPGYSGEVSQTQDWMRDGIRKDLLVTEEIAESSDPGATPFEFENE